MLCRNPTPQLAGLKVRVPGQERDEDDIAYPPAAVRVLLMQPKLVSIGSMVCAQR